MDKICKRLLLGALLATTCIHAQSTPVKPIIAQYYGIWTEKGQQWEQKFRADTPFDKLNRIYVSFARIVKTSNGHFTIEFDGDARNGQAIIDRMHQVNPSAELFLTLGGDGSDNQFGGAASDPQFTQNVMQFLNHYGFTGLDLDWEMGLDKDNLNTVVTNLSQNLHANGIKLTLDVWPFVTSAYDMPLLSEKLDQINIMSYGRYLDLDRVANQYIAAGFPADKIIGGVETETHYNGNVDSLGKDGSINKKAQFAKTNHLAGMMGWRLDNDYAPEDDNNMPTYKGALELWDDMQ